MKQSWIAIIVSVSLGFTFGSCVHHIELRTIPDGKIFIDGEYQGTGTANVVVEEFNLPPGHHFHVTIEQDDQEMYSSIVWREWDMLGAILGFFGMSALAAANFYFSVDAQSNQVSPTFFQVLGLVGGSASMAGAGLLYSNNYRYKDTYYFAIE